MEFKELVKSALDEVGEIYTITRFDDEDYQDHPSAIGSCEKVDFDELGIKHIIRISERLDSTQKAQVLNHELCHIYLNLKGFDFSEKIKAYPKIYSNNQLAYQLANYFHHWILVKILERFDPDSNTLLVSVLKGSLSEVLKNTSSSGVSIITFIQLMDFYNISKDYHSKIENIAKESESFLKLFVLNKELTSVDISGLVKAHKDLYFQRVDIFLKYLNSILM